MLTARSSQTRRTGARALTVLLAAAALAAGPLGPALSAPRPTDSEDLTQVDYRGHSFTVPASWQIVDLKKHPDTCVRFDRHAVYLGRPGSCASTSASGSS